MARRADDERILTGLEWHRWGASWGSIARLLGGTARDWRALAHAITAADLAESGEDPGLVNMQWRRAARV